MKSDAQSDDEEAPNADFNDDSVESIDNASQPALDTDNGLSDDDT